MKVLFYPMLPDFQKNAAVWKAPSLHSFFPLVRATCRWYWVHSTGEVIQSEENWNCRRKTSSCSTLSTTNLTRTCLGLLTINISLHFIKCLFSNSQKRKCASIRKDNLWIPYRERVFVGCKNIARIIHSKYTVGSECRIFSLKHGRTYSKHYAVKG